MTDSLVVAQGMTPQKLFDNCKESFPIWKYTGKDLDQIVVSERTAEKGAYAVLVRDRVEADKEQKNLSADKLKKQGDHQITLSERLLYEFKYFKETGKHLDIENITLCAGSRYSDGGVPSVDWYDGRLRVGWYSQGPHVGGLRSRRVVV